ncbi:MAG: Minf_1886 family protein [bacterium]
MNEHDDDTLDPVDRLVLEDATYHRDAYLFVLAAVEATVARLPARRHISGRELLEGIREFALERYGLMTKTVFDHWGVSRTEDFGAIVFRLVHAGVLSKTPEDSMKDFEGAYDFEAAFVDRFPWNRGEWEL